jgi:hypothetical protein
MNSRSPWKPNDWLRLLSLAGAFGLFSIGMWMLFRGILAEGVVDLKSTLFSGTLKTSSAGLYICFFALFIMIFVLLPIITPAREGAAKARGRARRLFWLFWALLFALAAFALGAAFLPKDLYALLSAPIAVLGVCLSWVVVALIDLAHEDNV